MNVFIGESKVLLSKNGNVIHVEVMGGVSDLMALFCAAFDQHEGFHQLIVGALEVYELSRKEVK